VVSFKVENRDHREVNPFTIRVNGQYALEEVENVNHKKSKPQKRERKGKVRLTLRDVGGRWLITEMEMPDRLSSGNQTGR
jgi:hypothetical protein